MAERIRALAKLEYQKTRCNRRAELFDRTRDVQDSEVTAETVEYALASLENKTQESLTLLKKAFILDSDHIKNFLRHKSALHFVVGCLISSDPYDQLVAMECCCNASLGDAKSCSLVASAGGVYMIQIVHGTNLNLINVALATLGNLAVSGANTCRLLHEQGLDSALMAALKVDDTREAAAKALCQYYHVYLKNLSDEEVLSSLECCLPHFLDSDLVQWLVGQMSARECVRSRLSSSELIPSALDRLNCTEKITSANLKSFTALIRTLGNMADYFPRDAILNDSLEKVISNCSYPFLSKEYRWFSSRISDSPLEVMES
ncbi:Hypothetical protein NTJ_08031 [Nesidiocoris tenuis]|uniref:Uncharacterized protein n=1 Tax=Nesidiocoris tenuis TaxID=355587 RepID=A0ABN7AV03_9HEMI|nr:Hypothetical protein NTJ_08031 [Nesidiocoris tenuis]